MLSNIPSFSYHASIVADFIRRKLLEQSVSFSFETVMSHHSKVDFLREAQLKGYRTYLYYVATIDPSINVSRVKLRVRQGGHDVPETKIRSRYVNSLSLLMDAIEVSNRAYIFDNSVDGQESIWLAEVTDGTDITLKSTTIPAWFQHAVWNKLPTPANPQ
jgi:predicted ABC-type ATPase